MMIQIRSCCLIDQNKQIVTTKKNQSNQVIHDNPYKIFNNNYGDNDYDDNLMTSTSMK